MRDRVGPRARGVIQIAVVLWLQMVSVASASFSSAPPSASMSISSGTLQAPTSLTAQNVECTALVLTKVRLTWTATTSAWADGYSVERSLVAGGPYTPIAVVTGATTTIYTDSPVLFSTTYHYVIRSTKLLWSSAASNQATITTPSSLCS